jgi:serine/threonine-protein kinase RsbW
VLPDDHLPHARLSVPSDGSYLTVLRTATSGLAARIHFTLEDIEDLRIAVDEACAILLAQARTDAVLECAFWVHARSMTIEVATTCDSPRAPSEHGFAWRVLSALAHEAVARVEGDRLIVSLTRTAELPS